MIARLKGIILEKKPPNLLIDVNGIGYQVAASMNTFFDLPCEGSEVILHIQTIIREDAHSLFGFLVPKERELFCQLIKVNGVGPKLALGILSGISSDQFVQCIQDQDTASLIKLPGIGKKTAERLIVEMQDKLKSWTQPMGEDGLIDRSVMASHHASDDAVSHMYDSSAC